MRRITRTAAFVAAAALAAPAVAQYGGQQQPHQQQQQQQQYQPQQQQGWFGQQQQPQQQQFRQPRFQQQQQQPFQQQQPYQQQRFRQQQFGQQQQPQQQPGQPMRLQGQIESVRTIQLQGEPDQHVLARIRMPQGQTVVVDLGTLGELRQQGIQLRRGQQLQVQGQPGRIQGQPILVVDRFVGDGQMIVLTTRQPQAQQQQQQVFATPGMQPGAQPGMQPMTAPQGLALVHGQLIETRQVRLRGLDQPHLLAKLRTQQGQTVVVDLGTGQQLRDINLRQGEWMAAVGTVGRINDRPVIFATQVADIAQIPRQQEQQQMRQQQQQFQTQPQFQQQPQFQPQQGGFGQQQQQPQQQPFFGQQQPQQQQQQQSPYQY